MSVRINSVLKAVITLTFILGSCSLKNHDGFLNELIETDREFSAMSQREGINAAFLHYMDDQATIYREGMLPFIGREALTRLYSTPRTAQLTWEPTSAGCAESGDLGYTLGRWKMISHNAEGTETVNTGFYVSIWKRQPDGSWKYVFDSGINGPEQGK